MSEGAWCDICRKRCSLPSHKQRRVLQEGEVAASMERSRDCAKPSQDLDWKGGRKGRGRTR